MQNSREMLYDDQLVLWQSMDMEKMLLALDKELEHPDRFGRRSLEVQYVKPTLGRIQPLPLGESNGYVETNAVAFNEDPESRQKRRYVCYGGLQDELTGVLAGSLPSGTSSESRVIKLAVSWPSLICDAMYRLFDDSSNFMILLELNDSPSILEERVRLHHFGFGEEEALHVVFEAASTISKSSVAGHVECSSADASLREALNATLQSEEVRLTRSFLVLLERVTGVRMEGEASSTLRSIASHLESRIVVSSRASEREREQAAVKELINNCLQSEMSYTAWSVAHTKWRSSLCASRDPSITCLLDEVRNVRKAVFVTYKDAIDRERQSLVVPGTEQGLLLENRTLWIRWLQSRETLVMERVEGMLHSTRRRTDEMPWFRGPCALDNFDDLSAYRPLYPVAFVPGGLLVEDSHCGPPGSTIYRRIDSVHDSFHSPSRAASSRVLPQEPIERDPGNPDDWTDDACAGESIDIEKEVVLAAPSLYELKFKFETDLRKPNEGGWRCRLQVTSLSASYSLPTLDRAREISTRVLGQGSMESDPIAEADTTTAATPTAAPAAAP